MQARAIYRFESAGRVRHADPLVLHRRLTRLLGGDYEGVLKNCHSPEDSLAELAYAKLARAVCTAFDLGEPFDPATGQGLLTEDWLPVFNAFVEWSEKNVPGPASTPTSPPPTATGCSGSPTGPATACGSTSPGSRPAAPPPSPGAYTSPLATTR